MGFLFKCKEMKIDYNIVVVLYNYELIKEKYGLFFKDLNVLIFFDIF